MRKSDRLVLRIKAASCLLGMFIGLILWISSALAISINLETTLQKAQSFLDLYEQQYDVFCKQRGLAEWNFESNLTDYNKRKLEEAAEKFTAFLKDSSIYASNFDVNALTDPLTLIQIQALAGVRRSKREVHTDELELELKEIFATAKVCPYDSVTKKSSGGECNLSLDPDLTEIMASSRNYDELAYYWKAWRDTAGKPARQPYTQLVQEWINYKGSDKLVQDWLSQFQDADIMKKMIKLWEEVEPLYKQLHAFVRRKLINKYGADKINAKGPIPAHLLGNMWAQEWTNIYDFIKPFPVDVDLTENMKKQNYTISRMMHMADDFYTSLGLPAMTPEFWNNSIFERPGDGRNISCHPTSSSYCDKRDYRIRMCSEVNLLFLFTCFHEMGHIEYFMLYSDQPSLFREGANSAFHEAVGDTSMMALMTPSFLQRVKLIDETANNNETEINILFQLALMKVAALPFLLLVELWRLDVFGGKISDSELNQKWWEYRLKYQGVSPPFPRTEDDFDPAAKHHIAYNTLYISYFMSRMLQFQFYKSLCEVSGHQGPLYKCDIYGSKAAGDRLRQGLSLGSSQPWPTVLQILTGNRTDHMEAGPMLEYFQPFYEFLKEANKDEYIGWDNGLDEQKHQEEKVIVTLN